MQMKKSIMLSTTLLALMAVSCGSGNNSEHGAASSGTQPSGEQTSSQASSQEQSSQGQSSVASSSKDEPKDIIDGLTVYTWDTYMDTDCVTATRTLFDAYAAAEGYEVTNQVWDHDASAKLQGFDDAVRAFDGNTENPKIDIILGAKGNFDTKVTDSYVLANFTALKNADDQFVTMTTYVGEAAQEGRRIWIANETQNEDAVALLVKAVADYDIPEVDPGTSGSEETSSEEQSSEELSSSEEISSEEELSSEEESSEEISSEEESSEEEAIVLDEIVVYCYENAVTEDQKNDLKNTFDAYFVGQGYEITVNTWKLGTTGKMAVLEDDIEKYNEENVDHEVDVILGARAAFSGEYMTNNYTYAGNDDADGRMTIGTSTNRRVAYNVNTVNKEAVTLLVNCFLPNLDFSLIGE